MTFRMQLLRTWRWLSLLQEVFSPKSFPDLHQKSNQPSSQEVDPVLSPADTIEKARRTESQAYRLYPYIETPNAIHQCIIFHTKKVKLNQVDWFLNDVTQLCTVLTRKIHLHPHPQTLPFYDGQEYFGPTGLTNTSCSGSVNEWSSLGLCYTCFNTKIC